MHEIGSSGTVVLSTGNSFVESAPELGIVPVIRMHSTGSACMIPEVGMHRTGSLIYVLMKYNNDD